MNFLYLSPYFPPNYQAFCIHLRQLGATVLGLGDTPYEALSPRLQQALHEYYRVDDLHNYDQLVRACGYFTHRYGKIDRLDSHAEYWLETEARLRTDFNIPGIKTDTIETIKRKSRMKAVFQEAGVPVVPGRVCHTLNEAKAFVDEVGFPMVAKPDIGVGAANTYKIESLQALESFFTDPPPPTDYFFEAFVSGDIYSFDGLVDRDGKLCFYTGHHYSQGIMETVNENRDVYYYSLRDIPPDLEEAWLKVLRAFNVRERFFHFEFFRKHEDGKLVALEVNMRPPGGLTTDMFNFANDFDIYREWANIIVNNKFEAKWSRPFHVLYASRKHHLSYEHSHEEIMNRYGKLICYHEPIPYVYSSALGNYGYLVRSPEVDEVLEVADFVMKQRIHELRGA